MAETNTFGGKTYTNGNVPSSSLKKLDGKHGSKENMDAYLRTDAADSFNRVRAEIAKKYGYNFTVRGWFRDLKQQIDMLLSRSSTTRDYGKGRRWYNGKWHYLTGAPVAQPGYSNHGWGTTIDINNFGGVGQFNHPNYKKFAPILKKHGWNNDEGKRIGEPWHWTYNPKDDKGKSTGAHTDNSNSKDWFEMATKADLTAAIKEYVRSPEGRKDLARAVWMTDGVLPAPADTDTKKNPEWAAFSWINNIRQHAKK